MSTRTALLATNASYGVAACIALARGRIAYGALNLVVAVLSTAYHYDEGSVALHALDVIAANSVFLFNAAWVFYPWPPTRARWVGAAVGAACGAVFLGASVAGSDPTHAAWHVAGGMGNLYVAAEMGERWWVIGKEGTRNGVEGALPKLV